MPGAPLRESLLQAPSGQIRGSCLRCRLAARQGEAADTSTVHLGFRCIRREPAPVG